MRPHGEAFLLGQPRNILVISPQPWTGFKVSKHQYAAELASEGHRVWFLDPPDASSLKAGEIIVERTEHEHVSLVRHRPFFPHRMKFHARPLFDMLMRLHARRIVRRIGTRPDLVWDFDNAYQFASLPAFGAPSIFHLVDQPGQARRRDKAADLLLSVSDDFLRVILPPGRSGHVIPHGLSRPHAAYAQRVVAQPERGPREGALRVGYVGNLEHTGIDWETIIWMIEANPAVEFRLIGPVAKDPAQSRAPVAALSRLSNCRLVGSRTAEEILSEAFEIDIWLICYDARLTVDGATNSHKALEYLATGNPVLSNRLAAYEGSDLISMAAGPSNADMPALLSEMIGNLPSLQAPDQRKRRAQHSLRHSYRSNLETIDAYLGAVLRDRSG